MDNEKELAGLFTEEEWQTLQFSPLWVFQLVAVADGRIDFREISAFEIITGYFDRFQNELMREVLGSLHSDMDQLLKSYDEDERKYSEGLMEMLECIKKVPADIALGFKKMMVAIGFYIADASGEIYGYKVTEDEVNMLSQIAHFLGLRAYDLQRDDSLNNDLDFLKQIYYDHVSRWK